jgi:hypothetical protein
MESGCVIELPCREIKRPSGEVAEVCVMVYSVSRHRFVRGRLSNGAIQYALFPGQYIVMIHSWHSEIKRARRLTAALVRLNSRCRIVPVAWRTIETHPENGLWRTIVRLRAFDVLPAPLYDFMQMCKRKTAKLMRIGEYNETQTKWLRLYIERGAFEAWDTIRRSP